LHLLQTPSRLNIAAAHASLVDQAQLALHPLRVLSRVLGAVDGRNAELTRFRGM
jgi:hypothetical protein